jgi:hypothetical protein
MQQHGLTGDDIEGVVRERNAGGVSLHECELVGSSVRKGATEILSRLGHPPWFAVNPGQPGGCPQIRMEQARPMALPTSDVRKRGGFAQPPALGHEIEEVAMPPEVALRTELLGGVGLRLRGHGVVEVC